MKGVLEQVSRMAWKLAKSLLLLPYSVQQQIQLCRTITTAAAASCQDCELGVLPILACACRAAIKQLGWQEESRHEAT